MNTRATALLLAALLAPSLSAQDSVSKIAGLPGDAVDAHVSAEQVNDYVVDLAAFRSSWKNTFGIAPIVKGSQQRVQSPTFFNAQLSAQAISRDLLLDAPFVRTSYRVWTGPGFGVHNNPARNDPGTPVDTTGKVGRQFGAAFTEFAQGDLDVPLNNVIGALVNYEAARPSRLYVSRIAAAVNSADDACDLNQIGFGGVDANGALYFRCDDNSGQSIDCGGFPAIQGNNYFRVRVKSRNAAVVNRIDNAGGADAGATDWLVIGSTVVHNTPTGIPTSIAGRPILIGSNFGMQYVFEQAPGTIASTSAHLLGGIATDQRGNVAYSPHDFPALLGPSTRGTAGMLAVELIGPTNILDLWGLAADGSVTGKLQIKMPTPTTVPSVIVDNDDGWKSDALGVGFLQFDHYHSQVAFRGGNGQVSIGKDQAGRLLAAAVANHPNVATPQTENNLIAVARVASDGASAWTTAGYTENADGKDITSDGGATVIGRMIGAGSLAQGFGPSVSAPMIDSVGNVWFLSTIELFGPPSEITVGLLRAVYRPATFSYELELVFKEGDVFHGRNSGKDYLIDFLDVFDSNSVSSGTAFSSNISASAFDGANPAALAPGDAETLGGLVIKAQIVYDVNGDGQFVRSTGANGTPGSPDEDYQVLLYVTATKDCNENGVPDDADIAQGTSQDLDHDGLPDDCETGTSTCLGDGSSTPCPGVGTIPGCANGAAGHGCANSGDPAGVRLEGVGDPGANNVVLYGTGFPPQGAPTVVVLRSATVAPTGGQLGDGLLCLTGATMVSANVALGGSVRVPLNHTGGTGTFQYQMLYRNKPAAFCSPAALNTSSGFRIVWP